MGSSATEAGVPEKPDNSLQQNVERWKQYTPENREFIKELYITTPESLRSICRRYQINYDNVVGFSVFHKWSGERNKYHERRAVTEAESHSVILADIRHINLLCLQKLSQWYYEKLDQCLARDDLTDFPLDKWMQDLDKFVEAINKLSGVEGVKKSVVIEHREQHNTLINVNGVRDFRTPDGPPGVAISDDASQLVLRTILKDMTEQINPKEITTTILDADQKGEVR